jgi:uncharacterized protein (TIGR02145 family)
MTTMSKQFLFLAALGCITAPVAAQTVDVTLQCGQTYAINSTVAASAVAGLTYRWLENGSTITGAAEANYTVPATKSVGLYTYIRQAKSANCADWQSSNAFTVEVKNTEGIDGVCLGGLMWAKYNVDEPGTFADAPDAPGKFYQFNRKTAYPSSGTCTWLITSIDEDSDWTTDNDPCPLGWRIPSKDDWQNLKLNVIRHMDYKYPVSNAHGECLTSSASGTLCSTTNAHSLFLPYVGTRSGEDAIFGPTNHAYMQTRTQYSTTLFTRFVLAGFTYGLLNQEKYRASSVRCVRN